MMKGDWQGRRPPLPLLGHLTSVAQRTVLPSLRLGLTFSQSSNGLVRPSLYGGEYIALSAEQRVMSNE